MKGRLPIIRSWRASRGGAYKATREDGKSLNIVVDINGFWILFIDNIRIGSYMTLGKAKRVGATWNESST